MIDSRALAIGTRASVLAMVQATIVRDALLAAGVEATLVHITTDGDVRAPDTAWGEGAFVTAIEDALIDGRIDLAIHSAKDVPTDEEPRLTIAAYLPREDARDALVLPMGLPATGGGVAEARPGAVGGARPVAAAVLDSLPAGARVGTDSPRRTAFLLAQRPDLRVHPIHGNVDTRLRRLDDGETDALVLAAAGLNRLGLGDRIAGRFEADSIPPAPGQGALAVQTRTGDTRVRDLIVQLDDAATRRAVELERSILARSGGGCRAPLGALAAAEGDSISVTAGYARLDGRISIGIQRTAAGPDGAAELAASVVDELARCATDAAMATEAPRVLVTRAAEQAAPTALALVDRGLAPCIVPAIAVVFEPDDRLDAALHGIADGVGADWVVLTSANAVVALMTAAGRLGLDPAAARDGGPRWAAIGRATAAAMREAGIVPEFQPGHADARSLAAELPIEPGARVLLPRGNLADPSLPDALERRGALVDNVVAYRTEEAPIESIPLLAAALAESPVAILATSGSTLRGLLTLAAALGAENTVRAIPVVAIGPGTSAEAERLGFTVASEAAMQGPGALADAVASVALPMAAVR